MWQYYVDTSSSPLYNLQWLQWDPHYIKVKQKPTEIQRKIYFNWQYFQNKNTGTKAGPQANSKCMRPQESSAPISYSKRFWFMVRLSCSGLYIVWSRGLQERRLHESLGYLFQCLPSSQFFFYFFFSSP